ncbi:Similar to NOF: 120.7 kDa protein in NOF-FB transposable element (Drosophila melanogaster), partial [Cotesia congregata]
MFRSLTTMSYINRVKMMKSQNVFWHRLKLRNIILLISIFNICCVNINLNEYPSKCTIIMPATSAVSVDLAVNALIKHISYFTTEVLPVHSSPVWKNISEELNGLWKVPAVRINVRQDRRRILSIAREKYGIYFNNKENISPVCNTSTDSGDHSNTNDTNDDDIKADDDLLSDEGYNDDEFENFHVTISRKQWNLMKRDEPFIYKGRRYHGFEPGVWTNIISFALWEQYRLKFAFVFKHGKINKTSDNYYATITGYCKDGSCLNPIRGIIKNPPLDEGPVVITMKCRDTRNSKHADVKRPLNGIDATGGLVKKLTESGPNKSGYIFLYQIVINFDGTTVPSLTTNNGLQPRTFIRLDTAHFLHTVSRWKCFQSVLHKIVKSFFLYCVALMIDCKSLSSLEEIFTLILIVCRTEFEDSIIAIDDRMITPGEAKKTLEKLIATRDLSNDLNLDLNNIDFVEVDPDKTLVFEELSQKATDNKGWSVALLRWIDKVCRKTNTVIFTGKKLNTHYVPELYGNLVDNMKDFPLWSNVCTPETMLRPNSCFVETAFKDLKMTLSKKVKLPTSVIKFLKLHIDDILGGINIFRSKLTKFVVDHCDDLKTSKEENFYENWKGKGKNEAAMDYDWTSDYAMDVSDNIESNYPVTTSENTSEHIRNTQLAEDLNDSIIMLKRHEDH